MSRGLRPTLIVVTDTERAPAALLASRVECLAASARSGSLMVLLRDKELAVRARLELGRSLLACLRPRGHSLVVAERLDLAALLGTDGAHLGEGSVSVHDARAFLGPDAWVSSACHEAEFAHQSEADAVLLSPVLAARKGRSALGVDGLAVVRARLNERAAAGAQVPALYALGGVNAGSARRCLDAGADGVAVIGAALDPALADAETLDLVRALRLCR